ncbi:MAG: P-loop NTPase [Planctomycetota bacterium]
MGLIGRGRGGGRQAVTSERVLEALRQVEDPDLRRDIVALGFVKNLTVQDGDVRFDVELTTPACPVKQELREKCEQVVSSLDGVRSVAVRMTAQVRSSIAQLGEGLLGVKNAIAVASGKGGVGKSTTAVNLALGLVASGARVGLLDADLYGPSVPTMLGVHRSPQVSGEGRVLPIEKHGLKLMSMGFVAGPDMPVILRGPMVTNVLRQFLGQVDWGELDYLVIDLPPGTGDTQLTLTQSASLSGAVIVTTPQEISLIDARKAIGMFVKVNVPILGIIENMSYFECARCGERTHVFGKEGGRLTAEKLGVPFLGAIPIDPRLVEVCDQGDSFFGRYGDTPTAGALRQIAAEVARHLSVLAATPSAVEAMAPNATPRVAANAAGRFPVRRLEVLDGGRLRILWDDGRESVLESAFLRAQCGCAACVDEMSGERRIRERDIAPDVRPVRIEPVGNYAVSIAWSDGHATGIYPFERLREMAPPG